LRLRVDAPCEFLAGQFMLFDVPEGVGRRAYSMSNAPDGSAELEFIVKRKPGGLASDFLFERLSQGDVLSLEGPYGHAYLRKDTERAIVGVADGSGLGPVWSVIQAALRDGCKRSVHLFFGVNEAADLFYATEFAELAQRYPHLRVERILMRAGADDPQDCSVGMACDIALRRLGDLNDCDLYMAGPPAMIDAALKDTVMAGKAAAERVFFDRFY
jgi:NAD(P)H-flavin reductase